MRSVRSTPIVAILMPALAAAILFAAQPRVPAPEYTFTVPEVLPAVQEISVRKPSFAVTPDVRLDPRPLLLPRVVYRLETEGRWWRHTVVEVEPAPPGYRSWSQTGDLGDHVEFRDGIHRSITSDGTSRESSHKDSDVLPNVSYTVADYLLLEWEWPRRVWRISEWSAPCGRDTCIRIVRDRESESWEPYRSILGSPGVARLEQYVERETSLVRRWAIVLDGVTLFDGEVMCHSLSRNDPCPGAEPGSGSAWQAVMGARGEGE